MDSRSFRYGIIEATFQKVYLDVLSPLCNNLLMFIAIEALLSIALSQTIRFNVWKNTLQGASSNKSVTQIHLHIFLFSQSVPILFHFSFSFRFYIPFSFSFLVFPALSSERYLNWEVLPYSNHGLISARGIVWLCWSSSAQISSAILLLDSSVGTLTFFLLTSGTAAQSWPYNDEACCGRIGKASKWYPLYPCIGRSTTDVALRVGCRKIF